MALPGTEKTRCFLLSLIAADGKSGFFLGGFCAARARGAHTMSSRGQSYSSRAVWPSRPHVPTSLCRGAGDCEGAKSLSGVGAAGGQQSRSCCSAGPCPGTDKPTTLDSLFFSILTVFSQIHSIFCSPCLPCWQGTSSRSCTGAGTAPITSLRSITALTFTGDRLQSNNTPEGGDVLPELGAFEVLRAMSSPRCPVLPQPPGIRVSLHDAAVTAAAEEGFEQEGERKPAGGGRPAARGEGSAATGHSSSPFPLRGRVFIQMRERGAEEQPAHPRPEAGLGG